MKIGVRKGGVCEWWSSCQVPSADLAFLSLSASSQSWSQSSYLLGTVSGGKAAVVYYNVYIVSLVLNWLSNLEFRRRKKVVQVVQIGGRGGRGNLDKIQKKTVPKGDHHNNSYSHHQKDFMSSTLSRACISSCPGQLKRWHCQSVTNQCLMFRFKRLQGTAELS